MTDAGAWLTIVNFTQTKMAILRPISKNQAEISLESEDGTLSYPSAFTNVEGFGTHQIVLKTAYDPDHFHDLIDYIFSLYNTECKCTKKLTVTLQHCEPNGHVLPLHKFIATECLLTGWEILGADRASGEISTLALALEVRGGYERCQPPEQ